MKLNKKEEIFVFISILCILGFSIYIFISSFFVRIDNISYALNNKASASSQTSAEKHSSDQKSDFQSSLININTATSTELQKLNGIGETISQRIVDYRNANGSFKTIEEIKNVKGIGEAKFEAIKDNITI